MVGRAAWPSGNGTRTHNPSQSTARGSRCERPTHLATRPPWNKIYSRYLLRVCVCGGGDNKPTTHRLALMEYSLSTSASQPPSSHTAVIRSAIGPGGHSVSPSIPGDKRTAAADGRTFPLPSPTANPSTATVTEFRPVYSRAWRSRQAWAAAVSGDKTAERSAVSGRGRLEESRGGEMRGNEMDEMRWWWDGESVGQDGTRRDGIRRGWGRTGLDRSGQRRTKTVTERRDRTAETKDRTGQGNTDQEERERTKKRRTARHTGVLRPRDRLTNVTTAAEPDQYQYTLRPRYMAPTERPHGNGSPYNAAATCDVWTAGCRADVDGYRPCRVWLGSGEVRGVS